MTRDELRAALRHPNVAAFLRVIRAGETNQTDDAYRMLFGGGYFASFDDHPRQLISAAGLTSSAAGAYQFLSKTWDQLVRQYGFENFTPASQDEAAVALIAGRKALNALMDGDLPAVLERCSWEWASLPPNRYGQSVMDAGKVYALYAKFGGTLSPATFPAPPIAAPEPEKKMPAPAFAVLAFEALSALLPTLIRMKSKSPTGELNAQIAEKAMPIIQAAVGASNAQEAVERIVSDPTILQKADQAVQERYYELVEVGGGGIAGAREYSLLAADKPLLRQPAFVISLVLLLFPLLLVIDVFFVHSAAYSSELRTQIVTGILLTISVVGAFWLGSSASSRTKDDAMSRAIK